MFPLLTSKEEKEEYDDDKSVRFGGISGGSEFADMRIKFGEWTEQHVELYFDKLQKFGKVLEIGAGYGFFMEACNQRGDKKFDIEGFEIGKFRLDHFVGGIVYNVNVLSDEIPEDLRGKYDCVICMHVLEHISIPVKFLQNIKLLLKDGGTAIFEVPNMNCLLAELSPEYSDFMWLYEHCSYYTADTLRLAFEKSGYTVTDVYSREIYSIENHCRWIREGIPFTKYNQMFMPDKRIEWINEIYKREVGKQGKGFSLIIEAKTEEKS
ncbi:MAG: class I SAM-dependent methyltransferase [Treponema sp.]|jgi:SAM-dependent methyltransferase|nr:class I SAM-dependent methyltransferase [Treponema sp.]